MKLKVFHHNGQLAEFPLDKVTGITVEGDHPADDVGADVRKLNRHLGNVLAGKPTHEPKGGITLTHEGGDVTLEPSDA